MTQLPGNLSATERSVSAFLGLSLATLAVRGGHPLVRALSGVASAALLARWYAGHCAVKAAVTGQGTFGEGVADQWERMWPPQGSTERDTAAPTIARDHSDAIDEAVNDSFPASDPPASHIPDEPPVNAEAKWEAARGITEPK
jgi:hypothetical protein